MLILVNVGDILGISEGEADGKADTLGICDGDAETDGLGDIEGDKEGCIEKVGINVGEELMDGASLSGNELFCPGAKDAFESVGGVEASTSIS